MPCTQKFLTMAIPRMVCLWRWMETSWFCIPQSCLGQDMGLGLQLHQQDSFCMAFMLYVLSTSCFIMSSHGAMHPEVPHDGNPSHGLPLAMDGNLLVLHSTKLPRTGHGPGTPAPSTGFILHGLHAVRAIYFMLHHVQPWCHAPRSSSRWQSLAWSASGDGWKPPGFAFHKVASDRTWAWDSSSINRIHSAWPSCCTCYLLHASSCPATVPCTQKFLTMAIPRMVCLWRWMETSWFCIPQSCLGQDMGLGLQLHQQDSFCMAFMLYVLSTSCFIMSSHGAMHPEVPHDGNPSHGLPLAMDGNLL